jgi:hypothetical protein
VLVPITLVAVAVANVTLVKVARLLLQAVQA